MTVDQIETTIEFLFTLTAAIGLGMCVITFVDFSERELFALARGRNRFLSQWFHIRKPLIADHGFNDSLTTLTDANAVGVIFNTHEQALFFEVFDNGFASFADRETFVLAAMFVNAPSGGKHADKFEVVAFANFIVVKIVTGSHFQCA